MAIRKIPAEEFVRRHLDAANNHATIYMYACYGFQVTDQTIREKSNQNLNGWYTPNNIAKLEAVKNKKPPVWGFDCVNLTKGITWGWTGDETKIRGGASYPTKDDIRAGAMPDTNANGMINLCYDVSTDFSRIEPGEGLWLQGHWGLYVGNGLAVECTNHSGWKSGVQITAVWNIGRKEGYHGRYWTKHGKLPWVAYTGEAEMIEPEVIELGDRTIKKGTQGADVTALQELLMKLGYNLPLYGADGQCGNETVAAIKLFQTDQGLEVDGMFGRGSYAALEKAIKALDAEESVPADPMVPRFNVTRRAITQAQVDEMLLMFPDCEVTKA